MSYQEWCLVQRVGCQYGLRYALRRLYNPDTKKGLLQVLRRADAVREVAELLEKVDAFFHAVGERADFKKGREFRVRAPDFVKDTLTLPLAELQKRVIEIVRAIEDEPTKTELQDLGRRIRDARAGVAQFLKQDAEDHVYWVERTGKAQNFHALNASPIDLAGYLHALLFREGRTCVLTSATLSIGSATLNYFRNRVGAFDVEAQQIGSPFDYERQMTIYITRKMPDPRDAGYEAALAERIEHYVEQTKGRAFVLFTSYRLRPFSLFPRPSPL